MHPTATTADDPADRALPEFLSLVGHGGVGLGSWFSRLAQLYLARRAARPRRQRPPREPARIVRDACIRSAAAGAVAAAATTGGALAVAEAGVVGLLGAAPAAVLAIGGEMLYRGLVHIEMICDLGEAFGVEFHADAPWDLWRLYALAFESGRGVVEEPAFEIRRLAQGAPKEHVDVISYELLGESVLRNIVPFVGIGASALRNWQLTRHVGETVHRYLRFRRNLREQLARRDPTWREHLELIVESFWFVFTADGHITDEEVAILAGYLRRLDREARKRVLARFVADDAAWMGRLARVPERERDALLEALELAATVDKRVLVPEEKLLRRAARALGRELDMQRLKELVYRLDADEV